VNTTGNELIGLPQVAQILGVTRQRAWQLYKDGSFDAVMVLGTDRMPRPVFSRTYITAIKGQLKLRKVAA